MQHSAKTLKRHFIRVGSCLLSVLLAVGSVPAAAVGDGVTPLYDEAYYAMTDHYGNLTEGSVVKSYRTNGFTTLTDYGDYDEVVNLTDSTVPVTADGKTTFRFDGDSVPDHFYFEGKTAQPFEDLPWTIAVSYTLNGVPARAEELAGQTGVVEIRLDAVPNANASEYARNNYTLEAMAIFDQDDILSLEAPGAQVQLIGNLRAVLFLGLPGEELHDVIRVGSEDFSFGGLTILMVPATLSQLEEIAKLSERKEELEENYDRLSGSMDSLLDAMTAMTGSLNASADGLDRLEQARGIFSDGKGSIYAGTDALRADLSNLADVLEPVEAQLTALSKTVSASKSTLNSMVDTVGDLKEDLADMEDALEELEDGTGDVKKVLSSLSSLQKSLKTLQKALGGQTSSDDSSQSGTSATATVEQVKQAHSAYVETDRAAFYQALLMLNGASASEASVSAAAAVEAVENLAKAKAGLAQSQEALVGLQAQLAATADETEKAEIHAQISGINGQIDTLDGQITALEAGIAAKGIDKLESAYLGKGAMTFQQFCQKVLGQSAATAKQMNDLWLVYASGKVEGGETPNAGGTLSGELLHNDSEGGGADDAQPVDGTGSNDDQGEDGSDGAPAEDPAPSESVGGAVVDLIAGGLDSAMEEVASLRSALTKVMNGLKDPTTQVVSDLAALCGRLADLSGLLDSAEDLSAAVRASSADLRSILGDVEDLQNTLNAYEPVLQESLKTVSDLSVSAVKTVRDTQTLISDTEALMKSTGSVLDSGTKQTLQGLSAVLRQTAQTMNTAGELRDAKSGICDIIEDTWNEYTGEVNDLLLMDATAEAQSLTDSRNSAPESIQVLIRTAEITVPKEADTAENASAAAETTTFWGRVAQMFRDFWKAITGLFGGKD